MPPRPRRGLIQLRHPEPTKKMPRMTMRSYVAARRVALAVLPKEAPGLSLRRFLDELTARLPKARGWERTLSAGWYAMAIKLDLEARGEIRRLDKKPPQRLLRTV